MARLRLRLPAGAGAAGRPRRPPRDHHPDARAGPGDVGGRARPRPRRDPRAEGPPAAADPDRRRRQRAEGDLAAGGAVRGRAEPRRVDPGRRSRRPCRSSANAARRSAAIRESLAVSVFIWGEAAAVAAGPERRQRFRDYEWLGLGRVIVQGFALVKDPHVIDDVIDDAVAVGLLPGPSFAQT